MSTLVFLENPGDEISQQALAFGRRLDGDVQAVAIEAGAAYAPAGWARTIVAEIQSSGPSLVLGPGTESGNEIMAHVAALLDQPMAANCTEITPGRPATLTRVRWGGSLLEEARLHGEPLLATVAPHVIAAEAPAEVRTLQPEDDPIRVIERVQASSDGVSLAEAKVVVSGGRGVGSAEGFAIIEELAALLGGAVGCSRAVTSAGWRPHTDQVGQTGTKVAPDIYIACGISGATQHMAGCKGAKKLLAINPDGEASIFAHADYAVIGDLHEVVPAISAEIRKVKGT
jgi:electron transfer flavoprotein alpha subunit